MFEILPESTERAIGFRASGKASSDDYQQLLPRLDAAIAAHGAINLLCLIEAFEGWESLDAAKADWRLGRQEYRQVQRAAFVSDSQWLARAVKLMDPFTRHTDERTFTLDQLDEAWAWVKEDG